MLQRVADLDEEWGMATLYSGSMLEKSIQACNLLLRSCQGSLQRIADAREICARARVMLKGNIDENEWKLLEETLSKRLADLKSWEAKNEDVMQKLVSEHPMLKATAQNGTDGQYPLILNYDEGRLSPEEHDQFVARFGFHKISSVDGVMHYDYHPPRSSRPVNWTAYMPSEFPHPSEWPDPDYCVRPSSLAPWADYILRPEAHPELWTAEMRRDLKPFWDAYVRYLRSQVVRC